MALAAPELTAESGDSLVVLVGPLTARQREVTALLAQGLSNRQIAERLVITERTVAAHIEHILNKLGLRSRTAIGASGADGGR